MRQLVSDRAWTELTALQNRDLMEREGTWLGCGVGWEVSRVH